MWAILQINSDCKCRKSFANWSFRDPKTVHICPLSLHVVIRAELWIFWGTLRVADLENQQNVSFKKGVPKLLHMTVQICVPTWLLKDQICHTYNGFMPGNRGNVDNPPPPPHPV